MSALSIQPTYPIFTDIDGQPLEAGYVWLGTANLDPQTNPINVYWDAALTILAPQPIRTLAGYPAFNGTPARLYVNSDYSIRVMNKNGSTVYSAPAATERYSDVVVTANAEDVIYDPPFANAVQTNVEAKLAQFVSAQDFGALGDGVTDDTTAIRNALAASNQVYFPPGTYMVNPDVVTGEIFELSNKTSLYISGYGATIKSVAGAGLLGADTFRLTNCTNVNIEGLTIDGNKQNQTGGLRQISIEGGSNIVIRDCNLLNSREDGIYIRATSVAVESTYPRNILIENVYVDNANRNGISVIGCKKLTIKNCTLVNTAGQAPGAGIDFEPNDNDIFGIEDVVVDGLFVEGNAGRGIVVTGKAPINPTDEPFSKNIAFSNIIARNNGAAGIPSSFGGADIFVSRGRNITVNGFIHEGQDYNPVDPALIVVGTNAENATFANMYFSDFQPTDNTKSCIYFDSSTEPYRFLNNVYAYNCNARVLRLDGFNQANNIQIQDCTGQEAILVSGASSLRNVLLNNSAQVQLNSDGGSVEGINIINPTGYGIRVRTSNTLIADINIRDTGTPALAAIWLDIFSNSVLDGVRLSDVGGVWATPSGAYFLSGGLTSLAGNFIRDCIPSPLSGSTTWDPSSIASGGSESTTVSLLRANVGDACVATHSVSLQGLISFASVTSANTATVTLFNPTGGAIDLASHTVNVVATK